MNIQKKVLLYCFITILVVINTWFINRIAQIYKPQTAVKGVQTKSSLPIPTRTLSLTPTPTPNKYTFSVPSITPTKTPSPTTNDTPNTTNNSSPTQSTDTTSTNPSSSDNSINVNSALTDQSPSFPSPTSQQAIPTPTTQQEVTSTPIPTTQPTIVQNNNGTIVTQSNSAEVGNTVIQQPTATPDPVAVGTSSESHACPKDQTC